MNQEAENIIKTHVVWAVGGGLIPIPALDFIAVTGIQMDMVHQLCELYNVSYYKNQGKSIIGALVGSSLARLGASALKAIPIFGSIIGGVSMSIMSGATTYAIGQVFNEHFKLGGDLSNLEVEDFRRYYKQKMEEGKRVAEELKNQSQNTPQQKSRSDLMQDKLKELRRMKDSGIISTAEYNSMRDKILDDFIG